MLGDTPEGHSFHDVYTEPRNIREFQRSGKWPDGAVLVKEVRHSKGAKMTTGNSNWATDMIVWFVMIKDAQGRFPKNPLWAEGWGWALFKADDPDKQVATSYKKDCLQCHVPAKDNDCVYVQGYPALFKAGATPASMHTKPATAPAGMAKTLMAGSAKGREIFGAKCSFCHNADSLERKVGPGLGGVKEGKLPSGKDATRGNILKQINSGGGGMPPFEPTLKDAEKEAVITLLNESLAGC